MITQMDDRRNRNPGADRRLWNEPRRQTGRTIVWKIGLPLTVGLLLLSMTVADGHGLPRLTTLVQNVFANNAPQATLQIVDRPSSQPTSAAPAAPAASAKPAPANKKGAKASP